MEVIQSRKNKSDIWQCSSAKFDHMQAAYTSCIVAYMIKDLVEDLRRRQTDDIKEWQNVLGARARGTRDSNGEN